MNEQSDLFLKPIDARFQAFHVCNPQVFDLFVKFAEEAHQAGVKIGAKAIAERIRWECRVITRTADYKINNSFVSRYARLVAKERPHLARLFTLRALKS